MKFYDCTTAPSPRRVRILMAEKGIEIDTVQVDLMKGEQLTEEFREINPLGQVPVLELDDGTRITEVMAICRYLEEIYPDNSLFGRDPVERAKVESINDQLQANGMVAVMEAFRNATPGFVDRAMPGPHNYEQIPALSERGLLRLDNFFSDLEAHLASNQYMVEDYFSIADITGFTVVEFARWVKKSIPDECSEVNRWYHQIKQRPSTAA
ncbi:MAG: glutathione S-transferase family protein [Porticoccaceae bacterium]|jgi:glutathione S-transferase|nr:glutathione S-transferase family protein [Porticoccaceae bacterium]MDG1310717.1 glutathione S-transferase family protein [Porticoccaceae bacterium]